MLCGEVGNHYELKLSIRRMYVTQNNLSHFLLAWTSNIYADLSVYSFLLLLLTEKKTNNNEHNMRMIDCGMKP